MIILASLVEELVALTSSKILARSSDAALRRFVLREFNFLRLRAPICLLPVSAIEEFASQAMQIIPELQLLSNKQRTHVHCVIKEGREEDLLTGSFLEDFPFHESW